MIEQDAMIGQRAGVFAQADHHHLHQAAFDGAVIAGVRLDAGHDADVIGLGSDAIEQDREALRPSRPPARCPSRRESGTPTNSSVMP